jgi:hypothetical protein
LPHRGEARLEGHAICGASAAGMKGAERPQGSNWVIRVFTEHLRIECNKMEQITILYHTFTIITHLNPLICHTFTMIYRYESMKRCNVVKTIIN